MRSITIGTSTAPTIINKVLTCSSSSAMMTSSYKLNIFRVEHVENIQSILAPLVFCTSVCLTLTLCPVFGVLWRIDCISAMNGKLYKQIIKWQRIGSSYWIIANDPKLGHNSVKRTRLGSLPEKWRNFVLYKFFSLGDIICELTFKNWINIKRTTKGIIT